MTRTITVEHAGETYAGRIGTITTTLLGMEDHGIFTTSLLVEWPSSGVSVGGFALDSYEKDLDRRAGTAYGLDHVMQILETVGVEKWEDVRGKEVIVLFEGDGGWGARSVGIANITDESKVFIPKLHAAFWRERLGVEA